MRKSDWQRFMIGLGVLLIFIGFNPTAIGCSILNSAIGGGKAGMSEIVITQSDAGKTFVVNQGEIITLQLGENPTTGYQWELKPVDTQLVELLDSNYSQATESATESKVGGGGIRRFRLQAKSPGKGQIQLVLRRAWEAPEAAVGKFSATIEVH